MTAHEHLDSEQFHTARELKESFYAGDRRGGETVDELWNRKLVKSQKRGLFKRTSLYDSVEREGVKKPLAVTPENKLLDGHHRVAAMYEIDPDRPMRVEQHDNWSALQKARR